MVESTLLAGLVRAGGPVAEQCLSWLVLGEEPDHRAGVDVAWAALDRRLPY